MAGSVQRTGSCAAAGSPVRNLAPLKAVYGRRKTVNRPVRSKAEFLQDLSKSLAIGPGKGPGCYALAGAASMEFFSVTRHH